MGHGGAPTYKAWLALNCPPPPDMDKHYVYDLWHYPKSGMQRGPWEVYGLVYRAPVVPVDADPRTFQEWKDQGYAQTSTRGTMTTVSVARWRQ